jgi:murein DD-endopeptidase MepM/ murein hydrolase activator NlpD
MYRWDDIPLRGADPKGDGQFAAGRGGKRHKGEDYQFSEGDPVRTPVSGIVTRLGWCYEKESYRLVEILSHKGAFLWRFLYIKPTVKAGQKVFEGDLIGHAQDIASKYGGGMKNHCHVEVSVSPRQLIGGASG